QAKDTGLGVPPFRPAPPKDTSAMNRSPLSPATSPVSAPASPIRQTAAQLNARVPVKESVERRTLVVGRGISVQGTVQDAERLVVEGTVESTMIAAAELEVSHGGVFKGEVEVEDAEIAGTVDGTLTARGSMILRATGRVLGTAKCRRLQVEDGGQITGRVEMITEAAPQHTSRAAAEARAPEPAAS
ncbi:MAG TPA: polymer-forming cytoskeletal protein, partial [Acetobacteraceae bacterium]|nr:polymer-forming cytoskeletal protein [Acetobacteraceae bacterium]